jgi:thiosulfate/3-mercaptopyruvate sulfurtransferase
MGVLIEVAELAEALVSGQPPVVADVRWNLAGPTGHPEFIAGHIPGARWIDLEHELSAPPGVGGRHPLPDVAVFQAAMRRIGVSAGTPVVVCDGATALAASRLWWLLTDAGHPDVRVLNGGFAAWQAAGQPVATGVETDVHEGDFVARPHQRPQVDAAAVAAALDDPAAVSIVDVRAAERYSGEIEPMDPVAGHIPGAINVPAMGNVDAAGKFVTPNKIGSRYADAGVSEAPIIYCGSGITAAHTLLALELAGMPNATIYPGSWSDWITDPEHPVATGATP